MGYRARGRLADFGRAGPLEAAARRTTERVGRLLHDLTVEHTPVAKPPPGVEQEWLRSRDREPGTLKASWKVGEVMVSEGVDGRVYSIEVWTNDPIAPYVEWPTLPHLIMPRSPGGVLRFWNEFGHTIYATIVHHTGTKGSYMLTTALALVAQQWQEIGAEEMRRWADEQAMLVGA